MSSTANNLFRKVTYTKGNATITRFKKKKIAMAGKLFGELSGKLPVASENFQNFSATGNLSCILWVIVAY